MEEFRKPLAQFSPGPSRRSSTANSNHFLDHLLFLSRSVLQQTKPNELPYQLYRWLRIILFLQWHVDVIDHENSFHESSRGTDHSPCTHTFEFVFDEFLRDVTACLR